MAQLECGAKITKDTKLDQDLTCPRGPALVVAADNVTLDLGGHVVSGSPEGSGDQPGIVLQEVNGCTVQNGTVQRFGAGVVISGGSENAVRNVTVQDNIGAPQGEFGDGIVVSNSSRNRIVGNTVQRNGPYSGISLVLKSQRNEVRNNVVADNNMMHAGDPGAGRQTMGIRIEGPAANHNRVVANAVTRSGGDGISLLATCVNPDAAPPCAGSPPNANNHITDNTCLGNGTSGQGSGIKLFSMANPVPPIRNTIRDNVANNNASLGIAVEGDSVKNKLSGNSAYGNRRFDAGDLNENCDTNVWEDNDFGTVSQACVSGNQPTAAADTAADEDADDSMVPVELKGRMQVS